MMKICFYLFVSLVYCSGVFAREHVFNAPVREKIVQDIRRFKNHNGLTSISFSMFQGEDFTFDYSAGFADIRKRLRTSPEYIYTLASVTKTITGSLVVELAKQGRLSLTDSVFHYIKGFPKNIRILDLLNHTSGFLREKESEKYLSHSSYQNVVKYLPVQFKLKIHRYANINYAALGDVIEIVTGRPFASVMKDFYRGITGEELYFSNHPKLHPDAKFVKNYVRTYRRQMLHRVVDFGLWEPAAFAQTSSRALAKFLRHQMRPNYIKFLEAHKVLVKKRRYADDMVVKECYSLGFRLRYVNDELRYIYHNGFLYGVLSTVYYFPEKDVGFAAVSNMSSYPRQTISLGGLYRKVEKVMDFDFNKKVADFTAKNGYLEGAVFYETMKREGELIESYLEDFAQMYLSQNKIDAALNILKLNAYAFPESAKTFQSLGEVYLQQGYDELAVENLKRSLKIDPHLTSSQKLLEQMAER